MAANAVVSRNPVLADGRTLLSAFILKQSVNFSDFRDSWIDMQFYCVYCAGADSLKREEIITCLYEEGLSYLIQDSRPDHERIAGLFLIHAVYSTQPMETKVLVRVTPDIWTQVLSFQTLITEKEYVDAGHILSCLISQHAFTITLTPRPKCLSLSIGEHNTETLTQSVLSGPRSLTPSFLSSIQEEIDQRMQDYHCSKQERKLYFPQHLLTPPKLPQELKSVVEEYNTSVSEALQRYQDNR